MNTKIQKIAHELLEDTIKNHKLLENTIKQLKQTKDIEELELMLGELNCVIDDMGKIVNNLEGTFNE